ncbi:MAG: tetratricopeptide repeat protein [Blastocatellia bacterium]
MKKYAIAGAALVILLSIIVWLARIDQCDDTDQICLIKRELRDYSAKLEGVRVGDMDVSALRYRDGEIVTTELSMQNMSLDDIWIHGDVALSDIAKAFAYAGDSRSALRIVNRIKSDSFKAYAQGELAGTFARLGDKQKADALFQDVIKTVEQLDFLSDFVLVEIAVSLGKQGEKEKAISLLSHWIKATEKNYLGSHTLYEVIMTYTELGIITKDSDFLEQAIKILDSDDPNNGSGLIDIAKSYARLGEKEKTRSLLLRVINLPTEELKIWEKNSDLNYVVHACSESVEFTKDRAVLEDAANVAERMGDGYSKIDALNAIAVSYARLGDDKALALLKNVIEIADRTGNSYFKVLALNATAISYAWLGEKKKASALLSDTLKIAEGISDGNFKGGSLDDIAFTYARLGELTKDRALLEESLNISDRIGAYEIELDSNGSLTGRSGSPRFLSVIAKSYARLGETKRDIALLEEAIRITERIKGYFDSEKIKSLALFEIVRAYVKLAEPSNDPESFLVDNVFKRPLPDYCKNQALDAILSSKSALADAGKLRSLTSHYSTEAGKALALARILTACSRPDLIGKENNLDDGGAR